MGKLVKKILDAIGHIADIWTVLSYLSGLGTGGGTVVAILNEVPVIYPIIGGIVTILLLSFAIIRSIISYKKWRAVYRTKIRVLTITDSLWKLSNLELGLLEDRIQQVISPGLIESIKGEIRLRLKLPQQTPTTLKESIDITNKVMRELGLQGKEFKYEHIRVMLTIGWVLDGRNVGVGSDSFKETRYYEQYKNVKNALDDAIPKVSKKNTQEAIISFQNIALGTDSIYLYQNYLIGKKGETLNTKAKEELEKEYGVIVSLPQFKSEREAKLMELLQQLRKLTEGELYGRPE